MSENIKTYDSENEAILQLKNVRQYFQSGFGKSKVVVKAVHNVSFELKKGEILGLVGESGCGKTTTGRSIIKLYDITDGEIIFKGVPISRGNRSFRYNIKQLRKEIGELERQRDYEIAEQRGNLKLQEDDPAATAATNQKIDELSKEYQEKIANLKLMIKKNNEEIKAASTINKRKKNLMKQIQMIFQDPIDSLDPRLTVREIIAEGLIINGIKKEDRKLDKPIELGNGKVKNYMSVKEYIDQKVNKALELVGLLPDHAGRYPHEFSGGQRQRIGIARALVVNPELIIADEPISALDVSIQAQIINLLNDIRQDMGLSILFIAHNLSVVKFFCDRIGVMYYGRLVEIATAEELFAHPLHPYTKSLLSAVPIPDPDYEKNRKRIFYNPSLRKYTEDKPLLTEIKPGHFVYASKSELERYEKELNGESLEPDPTLIILEKS